MRKNRSTGTAVGTPRIRVRLAALALAAIGAAVAARPLGAQEHGHDEGHTHDHGLHFTHPLFAESISPDRKVRLDYNAASPADARALELEAEYAFSRSFSLEAGIPYDVTGSAMGETHVAAKLASYALEDRGVLIGYGLALGLPTGEGHGHAHEAEPDAPAETHDAEEGDVYHIEPFLNAGLAAGEWEMVGWARLGFAADPDRDSELAFDASVLRRLAPRLEALVEYGGRSALDGDPATGPVSVLAPGLRVRPFAASSLVLGVGVGLPLSDHRDYDARVLASLFYHFE